jgi:hypothetical protein
MRLQIANCNNYKEKFLADKGIDEEEALWLEMELNPPPGRTIYCTWKKMITKEMYESKLSYV